MYEESCQKQLQEIIDIDRMLHEQILELNWTPMTMNIPRKCDLPSVRNRMVNFSLIDGQVHRASNLHTATADAPNDQTADEQTADGAILKHFIEEIGKQTEWFVDEQIQAFLQPYPEVVAKKFIQIDNVFEALNIQSIPALDALRKMFMQLARCEQCNDDNQMDELEKIVSCTFAIDNIVHNCVQFQGGTDRTCAHRKVIPYEQILPTLEKYLFEYKRLKGTTSDAAAKEEDSANDDILITLSRLISSEDINHFWQSFHPQFSSSKSLLWTALNTGLNKYLQVKF